MTSAIWAGYMLLMRAYGRRLQQLLSQGYWQGPHGFKGASRSTAPHFQSQLKH
jgi:hypothetical protein